jgi:hypothetical protein
MMEKTPRPGASNEAHRARETEGFADAFNSPNSKTDGPHQGAAERSANLVAALANKLATAVVERDGPTALVCTKRATALHEASHAVIAALDGTPPSSAHIWPIQHDGRVEWLGRTEGIPGGRVDAHSPVAADIVIVRSLLAGVVGERLFDPDARNGSSTHEIASAMFMVKMIAHKTGRLPVEVWDEIARDIETSLRTHEKIVCEIAGELMHKLRLVDEPHLNKLLHPIRGAK